MLDQWENIWSKGFKFLLNYNLKENLYKMIYSWYLTFNKLSKMHKSASNVCWKCTKVLFIISGGYMRKLRNIGIRYAF